MYVDGLSNSLGSGASILLTSPEGNVVEYALHFELSATNNEVDYKALINSLMIDVGVQHHVVLLTLNW